MAVYNTFRHGNETVLIVEAKRPHENISTSRAHAFQTRQYGYAAKVPVAILTNFDEFACYRCDIRPRQGDGPEVARIGPVLKYSDYLAEWHTLYNTFGKDAVFGDSLVRLARPHDQRTMIGADFSGTKFPSAPPPQPAGAPQPSAVQTMPGVPVPLPTYPFQSSPAGPPTAPSYQAPSPRRTPGATVAMQKKIAAFLLASLSVTGIGWKACSGPAMPPAASLVGCTVAAHVGFHLRTIPTASSVGPIYPAGTQAQLIAPIGGITRNDEILFQVQVLTTGQTGYAFVGPAEAGTRFNCPNR